MLEIKGKLRKWGNSLGLVIPLQKSRQENIKEGDEITAVLVKHGNVLKETFGTLKVKEHTQKIMKGIDKELDSDF